MIVNCRLHWYFRASWIFACSVAWPTPLGFRNHTVTITVLLSNYITYQYLSTIGFQPKHYPNHSGLIKTRHSCYKPSGLLLYRVELPLYHAPTVVCVVYKSHPIVDIRCFSFAYSSDGFDWKEGTPKSQCLFILKYVLGCGIPHYWTNPRLPIYQVPSYILQY